MKRIALLGDSHLAALMVGWKEIGDEFESACKMSFFGAHREQLSGLALRERRLVPATEELASYLCRWRVEHIALDEFDLFLVCALGFGITSVVDRLYRDFRSDSHRNRLTPKHVISDDCFEAATRGLLNQSLALRLARLIASVVPTPILIVPQPMPGEAIVAYPFWKAIVEAGDDSLLAKSFHAAVQGVVLPSSARIRVQPPATLATTIFSRQKYSLGSVRLSLRLDEKHPDDDPMHMNGDYGMLLLKSVLGSLEGPVAEEMSVDNTSVLELPGTER